MPSRLASLCTAALLVSAPAASRAGESANALLARARSALGGNALARVTTSSAQLSVDMQGLHGSGERVEDHRTGRFAQSVDFGVVRFAEGFDGDAPWSTEGNNPARVERGADTLAGAQSAAYRRTFSHLTARLPGHVERLSDAREGGRRYARLRIAPAAGRAFELWLDARTALPARVVERSASDLLTTTFDDWRTVDGVAVPFAIRESNGDAKYDSVIRVESLRFGGERPASAYAPPAPPPRDFGIAGDAAEARIPFSLENNHIALEVTIAGRRVSALLDTGAINVVTPELARELGLAVTGRIEGRGVGEQKVDVGVTQVDRVALGDAFLSQQTFYVLPLGPLAAVEGRDARAILGYEVFRRFVARIDYDDRVLVLHDPARFQYAGTGTALPVTFDDHTPRIPAEVDGVRGMFDVDTGSRASLTLAGPFVEQHGLRARYAPRFVATTGWGVGGPARAELARAGTLTIGGHALRAPLTHLSLQRAGSFAATDLAGNLGGGVLKHFDLTLDYPNARIWFEPNRLFDTPDPCDRSGVWLNAGDDALEVMDVTAGGPADAAGLRVGEKIRRVDGRPVGAGDLLRLRARFLAEPAGTRVPLEVEAADGTRREAVLVLADLV